MRGKKIHLIVFIFYKGMGIGISSGVRFMFAVFKPSADGPVVGRLFRKNNNSQEKCPGLPAEILNPRGQWKNPTDYDQAAEKLAALFKENFKRHSSDI
jgi:phosphoenolpyruvate carboxykinase (ATP)